MSIIDHGEWVAYRPAVLPVGAPANAMFAKREDDGLDWYDYVNHMKPFGAGSLILTVASREQGGPPIISAPALDPTALFPVNHRVVEITGSFNYNPDSLIDAFASKAIDLETGEVSDLAPPVPLQTSETSQILAALDAITKRLEKLEQR
jgi:hypothetical protein